MDRFIVKTYEFQYTSDNSLKSNMDRFIVGTIFNSRDFSMFKIQYGQIYSALKKRLNLEYTGLKSNMDRFIASVVGLDQLVDCGLKSNMDRFIVLTQNQLHLRRKV